MLIDETLSNSGCFALLFCVDHFGYLNSYISFTVKKPDKQALLKAQPKLVAAIGGEKANPLREPMNVVVDERTDKIYVADTGNNRIAVFDKVGTFQFSFGAKGIGEGLFSYPYGLLITEARTLWVSDPTNRSIQEFSLEGKFKRTVFYGSDGTKPGMLTAKDKEILVADLARGQIVVLDSSGKVKKESFDQSVVIAHPQGMAVDSKGRLWVADEKTAEIKMLAAGAAPVTIKDSASQTSALVRGLAVDTLDRVWATEPLTGRIRVLDDQGNLLFFLNAKTPLSFPMGIFISKSKAVFVAERGGNVVRVWQY